MSKGEFKVEDSKLKFSLDPNEDGQAVVTGSVCLSEGLEEAFSKGEAIEGAKVAEIKFELTELVIKIDTDRDGEELVELRVNLAEAVDEASGLFKK